MKYDKKVMPEKPTAKQGINEETLTCSSSYNLMRYP